MRDSSEARHLVKLSMTNLGDYLYDTSNLSVIRAASLQIDSLARDAAVLVASEMGEDRVVFAAASEALFIFETEQQAREAVKRLEQYSDSSGPAYATLVIERVEWRLDMSLREACARLDNRLRRAQMRQTSVVPGTLKGVRACELEGVRPVPADAGSQWVGDRSRRLEAQTSERLRLGREWRFRWAEHLFGREENRSRGAGSDSAVDWDESFAGLSRFCSTDDRVLLNKICVMSVDGNRFGEWRGGIEDHRDLATFSSIVEVSEVEALRTSLRPLWERAGIEEALPFHVLYWAGDEFCLVVPASHGVAVAQSLITAFAGSAHKAFGELESHAAERLRAGRPPGDSLTLSAGLLFCDSHHPIDQATSLAMQLCESAKSRLLSGQPTVDGVDFLVVESGMLPPRLVEYRRRHAVVPAAGMPLRGPLTFYEFVELIKDVECLKAIHYPRGRVHAFCRELHGPGTLADVGRACWEIHQRSQLRDLIEAAGVDEELAARALSMMPADLNQCEVGSRFVAPWASRNELWDYVTPGRYTAAGPSGTPSCPEEVAQHA